MATFAEVRPDLTKYYKPELNDGKVMSEISAGHSQKIFLLCDKCGNAEAKNIRNYCNFPEREFVCNYCKSIAFNHPHLNKQWNTEKNGDLTPYNTAQTANKKVWWKCENGHEWEAIVSNMTLRNTKCPYCNSLEYNFPEIVKEWNYDKNKLNPLDVSQYSNKKYWWKCSEGHEWMTTVSNRTLGNTNCPYCIKPGESKGEKIIADFLKENNIEYLPQFSAKVYKNKKRKRFDFYIPEEQIFIEVHGRQHFQEVDFSGHGSFISLKQQQQLDKQKQKYAEAHGKYIMVDYREHDPQLALQRFIDAMAELAEQNDEVAV